MLWKRLVLFPDAGCSEIEGLGLASAEERVEGLSSRRGQAVLKAVL